MPATTPPSIRAANAADAPALAELRWAFRATKTTPTEPRDAFLARTAAWMADRLASGAVWRAWVATDGHRTIIGSLWVALIEKLPNPADEPEEHAYISNVFVCPEHRGAGIGGALLDAALAWCTARGVHAVILWPTERSRPLYARHGFVPPTDIIERLVAPEGTATGA